MQLDIEVAEGEVVEGIVVRTADGRLELREMPTQAASPPAPATPPTPTDFVPSTFMLPSVKVVTDGQGNDVAVIVQKGAVTQRLELFHCGVPDSWPRDVVTAALCFIAVDGELALDEPRCFTCGGKGGSPLAPPGWTGGSCPVCDGTGAYVPRKGPPPKADPKAPLPTLPPGTLDGETLQGLGSPAASATPLEDDDGDTDDEDDDDDWRPL